MDLNKINFRAWHFIEQKMYNVSQLVFDEKGIYALGLLNNPCTPDGPIPLMQYTGLNDIKNRPIYEDDIIDSLSNLKAVVWQDGGFNISSDDDDLVVVGHWFQEQYEHLRLSAVTARFNTIKGV